MPVHRRSAVAGTAAFFACAVSSATAYTSSPLLLAGHRSGRVQGLQPRAGRRVLAARTSMIYTPPRIDEDDAVAVATLKRSLDRLVELPAAGHGDEPVSTEPAFQPLAVYLVDCHWSPALGCPEAPMSLVLYAAVCG
jgi:hypothetical protein